jgi:hypothetical protein
MFRLLSAVLATTAIGALTATSAYAGGCCSTAAPSCCASAAPSCCTTTAPATSDNLQSTPGTTQAPAAPNAARTFSYEPTTRANSASPARPQTPGYLVPKAMR